MDELERWWLSSEKMTIAVTIKGGMVVESAPIARKFIGQPAKSLGAWMRKQGGFQAARLHQR